MSYRIEKDTMGEVKVSADKLWGAQTERSRNNFKIGPSASMPLEIIYGFAYLKKAAAFTNCELGVLPVEKRDLIAQVCEEILEGKHDDQFPLVIWQTGSGTQSNMNVNEVVANRAHQLAGKVIGEGEKTIQPNDDVNKSQSSNDTFPTGMHIAAYKKIAADLNKAGAICKKAGIQLCYHNHDFEFKKDKDGVVVIDYLLENTDPKYVNFQMDLYWVTKAGADPLAYFKKYPDRFKLWHVKDMDDQGRFSPVGNGTIDFGRILKEKEQSGMKYYFVEQDRTFNMKPLEAIKVSHDALGKIGFE